MKSTRLLLLLAFCAGLAGLSAQVVVTGYTETGNLPANDDDYSAAVNLGFSINFGGTTYTQTFVSNNGYITFGSGSGDYYPEPIDANYVTAGEPGLPIIAAFFADVDTRDAQSGIVSWGTGTVDGKAAFQVKWPSVGEYGTEVFSPNTFSLILVSRTDLGVGDFDVFFNYTNITWDNGNAVAGFHNGSTTSPVFYQLPGSGTEGAFLNGGSNPLYLSSNTGSAGAVNFQARTGGFVSIPAITAIPEPSTWALFALGIGLLGLASYRRRSVR